MDPYALLGVTPESSAEEIKNAWKLTALKLHPDRGGDTQQFAEARKAYNILLAASTTKTHNPQNLPEHNPFIPQPGPTRNGKDLTHDLTLTFNQAYTGGQTQIILNYDINCKCGNTCQICNGKPIPYKATTKIEWAPKTLKTTLQLPARGAPGVGGGRPGTLTVHITVENDPNWTITEDGTLKTNYQTTIQQLVYGDTITIPHPAGQIKINIPQNTQPGTTLSIPNKGWNDNKPCLVTTKLKLPQPTEQNRQLLQNLTY